jgi:hypothetical protein
MIEGFKEDRSYVKAFVAAMRSGWNVRPEPESIEWLCPSCCKRDFPELLE